VFIRAAFVVAFFWPARRGDIIHYNVRLYTGILYSSSVVV
jgi:hypothetical protein